MIMISYRMYFLSIYISCLGHFAAYTLYVELLISSQQHTAVVFTHYEIQYVFCSATV